MLPGQVDQSEVRQIMAKKTPKKIDDFFENSLPFSIVFSLVQAFF